MRTHIRTLMDEALRTRGEDRVSQRWLGNDPPRDLGAEAVRLARLAAAVHLREAARPHHALEDAP